MKTKTKRNILYFLCFLGGLFIWSRIGSWWGAIPGFLIAYMAGCWLSENFGWRRASNAADAFEYWSDEKKEELKSYDGDVEATLVAMLAKLAKLEGRVSKQQIAVVEQILLELDIVGEAREASIEIFQKAKSGPLTFYDTVLVGIHATDNNPQFGQIAIPFLIRIANADGSISPEVRESLQDASTAMGYCYEEILEAFLLGNNSQYQSAQTGHANEKEDAYSILGCSPSDTDAEVKAKYRELAKTFHPDTIASKALPAEFTKFAAERFKQIQSAYETIMESRKTSNAT